MKLSRRERDEIRWDNRLPLIGGSLDAADDTRRLVRASTRFLVLLHEQALLTLREHHE